jgi:hypothetical protein
MNPADNYAFQHGYGIWRLICPGTMDLAAALKMATEEDVNVPAVIYYYNDPAFPE